jgi:hypothetical protein
VSALQFGVLSIAVGLGGVLADRLGKRWIAGPLLVAALALGIAGFILLFARSV